MFKIQKKQLVNFPIFFQINISKYFFSLFDSVYEISNVKVTKRIKAMNIQI